MLERMMSSLSTAIVTCGALALLATGCADTPSSPPPASIDNASAPLARGTAPSLMGDERPTGAGIFAPKPYERWLRELHLTDAQAASARRCLEAYRGCLRDAEITFIHARNELQQKKQRALQEIRTAVANGRITADEGRTRMRQIEERTARAMRELEAGARSNVANCERTFEHCIREFLTREQIARWERLSQGNRRGSLRLTESD